MDRSPDEPSARTALYRLYDAGDQLLYVGISRDPSGRFKAHAHEKSWWHHVVRTEIEWRDGWKQAREAEDAAIRSERPLYNGTLHLGPGWRRPKRRYDDTSDVEQMTGSLRDALRAGTYRSRRHLWPLQVGEEFGFSRSVANSAMHALVAEGLLEASGAGYWVR